MQMQEKIKSDEHKKSFGFYHGAEDLADQSLVTRSESISTEHYESNRVNTPLNQPNLNYIDNISDGDMIDEDEPQRKQCLNCKCNIF